MTSIGRLLEDKGHEIWSTTPQATVQEALALMAGKNIGAVVVLDGAALAGILSERDCARKVLMSGKRADETRVEEAMTDRVVCIHADQSEYQGMALMTERRIRHLPVLDRSDRLIGVISIGDLGRAIMAQQEFTIAQLETYITGARALTNRAS
jgi:signal-transduction protein with cAMP-binding, CBS, and nucleotidyltransferase domain